MRKILISIIAFFILSLTYAQNISQQQLSYIHKKSKSLLEEYEQYFNLVGDINEPHNDREGVYIPSFTDLFIDEAAIHYNDLDPEGKTSVQLPINQYALNTILWYPVGVKNMLELLDIKYGKVQQISSNSYYINVYVNRTISGIFMDEKPNRSTTKLEFRVSFVPNGQLFNNFRIAGVTKASENVFVDKPIHNETLNDFTGNSGTFIDSRDGNDYKWVHIGNQIWMAENINYSTNNSFCYEDKETNCDKYGRIYLWEATKKACPSGWHLPSDNDWKELEVTLGMIQKKVDKNNWRGTNEGGKMKSTSGWYNNGNGSNSSGFNAIPGHYGYDKSFGNIDSKVFWWCSSEYEFSSSMAYIRTLSYEKDKVYRYVKAKINAYSVRCLRD